MCCPRCEKSTAKQINTFLGTLTSIFIKECLDPDCLCHKSEEAIIKNTGRTIESFLGVETVPVEKKEESKGENINTEEDSQNASSVVSYLPLSLLGRKGGSIA